MKILFIQTGGTIDKDYPKITSGYAFEINDPAVNRILSDVNPSFEYEVISVCRKDSTDINDEDRVKIYNTCKDSLIDKIIVTHGTDTMLETAEKLSDIKDKTIVITGSMRPEKFTNTDADFNIGLAVGGVQTLPSGVYIAMHGMLILWNKASRDLKTGQFIIKK
jgi:L-asparaginase